MNDDIITAFTVSGISLSVIFVVLTILIFTIKILVRLLPYEEPPPKPARKAQPTAPSDMDEDIAIITSVMASHLSRTPGNFQVVSIQSK